MAVVGGSAPAGRRHELKGHSDQSTQRLGILRYRLLIDIEDEEAKVCQNGTLEGALGDPASPPFPLRLPTIVPP